MLRFLLFLACINFYSDSYGQLIIEKPSRTEFHILFVGNSLTYTNNLPRLVRKYARSRNINVQTEMIAFANYALEDHWNEGQVQKLISSQTYDFVIVQQGPSSQSNGRIMLMEYGAKFNDLCQLNSAQLCFFMVWPSMDYYSTFEDVIKNHRDAASKNNAILLPVGQAWKDYIDNSKNFEYYGKDGFHPSSKGSEAAAKVIVNHLFQK